MPKLLLSLAACLVLTAHASALDVVTVDAIDKDKLTVSAKMSVNVTVAVPVTITINQGGQNVQVTQYQTQIKTQEQTVTYSLKQGKYLDGNGNELSPGDTLQGLKKGGVIIVGGEELRAAIKAKVFRPEVTLMIRDLAPPGGNGPFPVAVPAPAIQNVPAPLPPVAPIKR